MAAARTGAVSLFVGNIPWTVSQKIFRDYFSKFGKVQSAVVRFDRKTGLHLGYGFIQFTGKPGYEAALCQQVHELEGSQLTVRPRLVPQNPQDLLSTDVE